MILYPFFGKTKPLLKSSLELLRDIQSSFPSRSSFSLITVRIEPFFYVDVTLIDMNSICETSVFEKLKNKLLRTAYAIFPAVSKKTTFLYSTRCSSGSLRSLFCPFLPPCVQPRMSRLDDSSIFILERKFVDCFLVRHKKGCI